MARGQSSALDRKKLMADPRVDEVICATDADREGECIFRYVYHLTGCKKPVKRLWVSSLEETAIKAGFAKLKSGSDYDCLFQAGFCRAKADWLVGMNGSTLFSMRYHAKLSIGRVLSSARSGLQAASALSTCTSRALPSSSTRSQSQNR